MKLLSVSLPRHDGNMAYYDGQQLHYIKLERLTQRKRDYLDPHCVWPYVAKDVLGVDITSVDAFIFDFHAETFFTAPYPEWLNRVLDGTEVMVRIPEEDNMFKTSTQGKPVWYVSHHYAHALSTWMLENTPVVTRFVIDGVGDHRTWSVFKENKLVAYGDHAFGSIGGLTWRSAFELGVTAQQPNDLASKLMSLQSYGALDEGFLQLLQEYNINQLLHIFDRNLWVSYKGDDLVAHHTSLSWVHTVLHRVEELLLELFSTHATSADVITYAGGVAQNVVWNTALKTKFPNLIIPPHSSDEGLSLGAIEALRLHYGLDKFEMPNFPYIQRDHKAAYATDATIKKAARALANNNIVAWYQGNGEAGPRALGNRSILMNPCVPNGKALINGVKQRENYRPFGASVLEEYADEYFDMVDKDEFMLFTAKVKCNDMPAITHVDGTCRVQTVGYKNPTFRKLLEEFKTLTGIPILLNTSLNLAGAPIAGYPEIAELMFNKTNITYAVIGDTILGETNE